MIQHNNRDTARVALTLVCYLMLLLRRTAKPHFTDKPFGTCPAQMPNLKRRLDPKGAHLAVQLVNKERTPGLT